MGSIVCSSCKNTNDAKRYFCGSCGKFLHKSADFTEAIYGEAETKMMRLLENLKHKSHEKIVWDDAADLCAARMEKLKAIFGEPEMGADTNAVIGRKMDELFNLCYHPEFQIAFVGTIKTGKSTLINALLGKNYASMAVTPETAALTKFRASKQDYVQVTFYTKAEWNALWKSRTQAADAFMREYRELQAEKIRDTYVGRSVYRRKLKNSEIEEELGKWSTSQRAEHYFVKEIEVGISTLPEDFPPQVVFVDTPGLFDPVAYRSELTRDYIRRANAVFMCVDAQKIQKEEFETISSVFSFAAHDKNKVFVVATHWDALNDPDADWQKQKGWLTKQLVGPAFYDKAETANNNIMHSAAFIYNLIRDYGKLSKGERKSIIKFAINYDNIDMDEIEKYLPELQAKTNIRYINSVLREKVVSRFQTILAGDIKARQSDVIRDLRRIASEKRTSSESLVNTSSQDLDTIKGNAETQKKRYEEIRRAADQLQGMMDKINEETEARMELICNTLRDSWKGKPPKKK